MMTWQSAFSGKRFGTDHTLPLERSEFERDWDRLIFSSAFRRLQGKTQVFPLPEEIFVHNRLTHSLEVASVGRSLGAMVGSEIAIKKDLKGAPEAKDFYQNHLKSVIAAACLAHDLGNPAFGHSGESAISRFFLEKEGDSSFKDRFSTPEWEDLVNFEGNANALRILTRNFQGRTIGGFRLTLDTLGAILKYPCSSTESLGKKGPTHRKKYGFFQSDKAAFQDVVNGLGMKPDSTGGMAFHRHPFVYLVEAADDICYNIIDFEDAHRLGVLSTAQVTDIFMTLLDALPKDQHDKLDKTVRSLNKDANEKIGYLRAKCINFLARRCADIFLENGDALLNGTFQGDLMHQISEVAEVIHTIEKQSVAHIYNHESVIKIELAGYRIMAGLIEDFVLAALCEKARRNKMQTKILDLLPGQFRFDEATSDYEKVMCILDFISGMTDHYALKLYRNLRGIEMPVR